MDTVLLHHPAAWAHCVESVAQPFDWWELVSGLWLTRFCISPQVALRDEILWQPDRRLDPTTSRSETESATTEPQKLAFNYCWNVFQSFDAIERKYKKCRNQEIFIILSAKSRRWNLETLNDGWSILEFSYFLSTNSSSPTFYLLTPVLLLSIWKLHFSYFLSVNSSSPTFYL